MSKEFREEVRENLKKERPNLSVSSQNTYVSLMSSLSKKLDVETYDNFVSTNVKVVMKHIEELKSVSAKKTVLSALYILTKEAEYKAQMDEFITQTNKQYRTQTISDKRKDAYLTPEQVKEKYEEVKEKLKRSPSSENYVNYIIAALMSGARGIEPRRLEWSQVVFLDDDTNKTEANYLDLKKSVCVFNQYKTRAKHGVQQVKIPADIMKKIRLWVKINPTNRLLVTKTQKPMSANQLSHRIGEIFGDKVGVSVLRSIYVSELHKDIPDLNKLMDTAEAMGHSLQTAMLYYAKKK
jgi:integrase